MDLFENTNDTPPVDDNKDFLAELVGEGKKFKDVQSLARGKAESDAYIQSLKTRLDDVEKDRQGRINMEDFLNQLKSTKEEPPKEKAPDPAAPPKGITEEEIRRLLDEEYTKKEKNRAEEENFKSVQKELSEKFGPNYGTEVKKKADSLGLGQEFLNSLARQNPKAFMALVGPSDRKPVNSITPPRNVFGTETISSTPIGKTFKDFQEIRRKDPHRYFSPEVQSEIHKLAQADPIGFGLKP